MDDLDTSPKFIYDDLLQSYKDNGSLVIHTEILKLTLSHSLEFRAFQAFKWSTDFAKKVRANTIVYTIDNDGNIITIEIK